MQDKIIGYHDLIDKIINYRELIDESTRGFVGRQWVRDAIDAFLAVDGPRYFLLLGEPGSGKTTFMADVVRRHRYPHHFIGKGSQIGLAASADWRDPIAFAWSIGYQLIRDYGSWVVRWEDWGISVSQTVKQLDGLLVGANTSLFQAAPRPSDRPLLTVEQEIERFGPVAQAIGVYIKEFRMDPEPVVRQLVTTPLTAVANRWPDSRVVVVVDALDEAEDYSSPNQSIFKLLPNAGLPANVRFLLSSRPGRHLTPGFLSQACVFWLSEDDEGRSDPRVLEDARAYVLKLTEEEPVRKMLDRQKITPQALSERVAGASQGNFLYLHHYAQGVRGGDETLLRLEGLPTGLYGIYADFLEKISKQADTVDWDKAYKPVLGTLAVAQEPLTRTQIAQFSHVPPSPNMPLGTTVPLQTVGTILVQLKQFLDARGQGRERRYALYHKSFGEYLISEENEDFIDGRQAQADIAEFYFRNYAAQWHACDAYGLRHLSAHLHDLRDDETHRQQLYNLIDKPWMEAKLTATGSYRAFSEDVAFAIETARGEQPPHLPQLIRNCLLDATLSALTSTALPEVLGLLAQLGETQKASDTAALIQDPQRRSRAYYQIAKALLSKNETAETRIVLAQAVRAAHLIAAPVFTAQVLGEAAPVAAQAGDSQSAHQLADQAMVVASRISDEKERTLALGHVACSLARLGDADRARQAASQAVAEARAWKLYYINNEIFIVAKSREEAAAEVEHGVRGRQWSSILPKAEVLLWAAETMVRLGDTKLALEFIDEAQDETRCIQTAEERAFVFAEVAALLSELGETAKVVQAANQASDVIGTAPDCADVSFVTLKMSIDGSIMEMAACYNGDNIRQARMCARRTEGLARAGAKQAAADYASSVIRGVEAIQDTVTRAEALGWVAVALAHAGDASRAHQIARQALEAAQRLDGDLWKLRVPISAAAAFLDADDDKRAATLAADAVSAALELGAARRQERWWTIDRSIVTLAGAPDGDSVSALLQFMREKQDEVETALWTVRARTVQGHGDQTTQAADGAATLIERIANPMSRAWYCLELTELLAEAAQAERAVVMLDRVLETAQEIESASDRVELLCRVADSLAKLGKMERAAREAENGYALAKTIPDPRAKADALARSAAALAQASEYEQAEAAARAIAPLETNAAPLMTNLFAMVVGAVGPNTVQALAEVGSIMARSHEFDRAYGLIQAELGYAENSNARTTVLEILAYELAKDRQWTRAREVADMIPHPDRQSQALSNLSVLMAQAEKWDAACSLVQEIKVPGSKMSALYRVASHLAQSGQWERALVVAKTIRGQPWGALALTNIALALAQTGDQPRAVSIAEEALEGGQQNTSACDRANLLCRAAEVSLALREEAKALTLLAEAFDTGRREGRDCIFQLLEEGAYSLAKLDRGETLWNAYSAVREVETWWGI
jgi:hypothetical protein